MIQNWWDWFFGVSGVKNSESLRLVVLGFSSYRTLCSAATDLMWVQHLLTEIGISVSQPPMLWSDNSGAQALACNSVYHAKTKHIELDVHFIRNLISEHKLEVRHVPTESQPADVLTKPLSLDRFKLLCSKLTMCAPMLGLRGHVEACDRPHITMLYTLH